MRARNISAVVVIASVACGRTDFGTRDPSFGTTPNEQTCATEIKSAANTPINLRIAGGELFWLELTGENFSTELFRARPCSGAEIARVGPATILGANDRLAYWSRSIDVFLSIGGDPIQVPFLPATIAVDEDNVYTTDSERLRATPRRGGVSSQLGRVSSFGLVGARNGFVFDRVRGAVDINALRRINPDGQSEMIFEGVKLEDNTRMGPDALYTWGFECTAPRPTDCFRGPILDESMIESRIVRVDQNGRTDVVLVLEREVIDDVFVTDDKIWFAHSAAIWSMERTERKVQRVLGVGSGQISIAVSDDTLYWANTGWIGDVVREGTGTINRAPLSEL